MYTHKTAIFPSQIPETNNSIDNKSYCRSSLEERKAMASIQKRNTCMLTRFNNNPFKNPAEPVARELLPCCFFNKKNIPPIINTAAVE